MSRQSVEPQLYLNIKEAEPDIAHGHEGRINNFVRGNEAKFAIIPLNLPREFDRHCHLVFGEGLYTPVHTLLSVQHPEYFGESLQRMQDTRIRSYGDVSLVCMRNRYSRPNLDSPVAILISNAKLSMLYAYLLNQCITNLQANHYVVHDNHSKLPIIVVGPNRVLYHINLTELKQFLMSQSRGSRYARALTQFQASSQLPKAYLTLGIALDSTDKRYASKDCIKGQIDDLLSSRLAHDIHSLKLPNDLSGITQLFNQGMHTSLSTFQYYPEKLTLDESRSKLLTPTQTGGEVHVGHVAVRGSSEVKYPFVLMCSPQRRSFLAAYLLNEVRVAHGEAALPVMFWDYQASKGARFVSHDNLKHYLSNQDESIKCVIRAFNASDEEHKDKASARSRLFGAEAKRTKTVAADHQQLASPK